MSALRLITLLLMLIALSGCVQNKRHALGQVDNMSTSAIDRTPTETNFSNGNERPSDYRISASDVLEISVLGVPDLNRTVQVSAEGFVSLPLIRVLKAGGLTGHDLEGLIASKLAQSYMQAPEVSVYIKEFTSQRVTVDGAVVKPGIYPFSGKLSLLQALALSQGLTELADPKAVLVFRSVAGADTVARFDLKQIRAGQAPNPNLLAGDIVTVDQSRSRTTLKAIREALPFTNLFQLLSL